MKPCIVIQTDFSTTWGAVSSMKGVMKIVDPTLDIVDLSHDIEPFNVWEASKNLHYVEPFWPKGTIFVSVVDPGVGTKRKACVARLKDGSYIVCPNNGTLTHLFYLVGIEEIREIDENRNRYLANENVEVFHGRDLFGYCAAKLASGIITFEEVGPKCSLEEIIVCEEYHARPILNQNEVCGFVSSGFAHFGNITINVLISEFNQCGFREGEYVHLEISCGDVRIMSEKVLYAKSFGHVKIGEPIIYNGSSKYINIACNQASFMETYSIRSGITTKVRITK